MRAAGTAAVSCVADTKVVVSRLPFQVTVVVPINPVPFAVRVKAGPPAATLDGEMLVSVSELVIVKGSDAGCGDPVTLTAAVPAIVSSVAGTTAVSCVEDTKVVANSEPFQVTVVPTATVVAVNPDPFTVSVRAGLPAGAELGDRLIKVTAACGAVMVKVSAFEDRFPFCAVTLAEPCCAIRFAGTVAVIRLAFTTVVESTAPFQRTFVPAANPAPLTVRVKDVPPACVDEGERLVNVKTGWVITKESGAGDVWPEADTPTEAVPAVAIRFAGTAAVSCVAETKVVLSGDPFQVTTVLLENPDPLAVRVNAALPATAVLGEMLVRVSAAAVIVNVTALETWPPLWTVIDAEPACTIRFAGTVAVTCPVLTGVVASAKVFQYTIVLLLKPVPFTVSVKAGPPDVAEEGEMLVIVRFGAITKDSAAGDV